MSIDLGRIIRKQWEDITEANKKYPLYETVGIPLTKLKIDSKSVYLFLKDFSTMLNDNPNLLTLIHDGKNVLKAYAEGTKDGVYNSIIRIDFDGWEKSTPLNDAKATFEYVKPIAKQKTGIDVGLLKLGHVDFFKEFHPVFDDKSSNLESICRMYDCTRKVVDNNLIAFYPEPKLLRFLTETKNIILKPEILESYITRWLPDSNYGVLIKANDGLIGMVISKREKNLYIEFVRKEVEKLSGEDIKSLTDDYRKKLGLSLAVGLETCALKGVADNISNHSLKDKEIVEEAISFVKNGYGKNVYVSINPVLNPAKSLIIRHMPVWPVKKIGCKIQEYIFA
ncbi:hypothetical protein FJZ53_05595 [Candidatus Woesearchaeota archaeon]|nr:hypothetical protein [Candidatus Woesearchaeota archaeon]